MYAVYSGKQQGPIYVLWSVRASNCELNLNLQQFRTQHPYLLLLLTLKTYLTNDHTEQSRVVCSDELSQ